MPCPECEGPRPVKADNPHHPFCSYRCKMVDLGRWLGGAYRIAGSEPADVSLLPEAGEEGGESW